MDLEAHQRTDQEEEQTKGRQMKGQHEENEAAEGREQVVKLHEFDRGGGERTGFRGRETMNGSHKVIKYHSGDHPVVNKIW